MENKREENLELILQGCLRKNEKSQEVLYKKFFGYALGVALIYHRQRTDALEVVNDSFVKVFSKIGKYDPAQSFPGWLRKIVVNTSIDYLRRKHKNYHFVEADKLAIEDEAPNALSNLTAQNILEMLDLLPHIHKTVFCLYEIEGFNHEEIAEQLGIPESSSRVYLMRAKKQLRELFQVNSLAR